MKKILLTSIFAFLVCMFASTVYAQVINSPSITAPWLWRITSDFGPRVSTGSWFHPGIDYGGPDGASITAVEGGTIYEIVYRGGWLVTINGSNGDWTYLHMFAGVTDAHPTPVASGNWELTTATLVHPTTGVSEVSNVIILWSDSTRTRAEKVLCISWLSGRRVLIDNNPVLGVDSIEIRSQGSVVASVDDPVAPVGTSGGTNGYPPHLHLGLNSGADNPLFHLIHTPDALPTVTIGSPENNHIFKDTELHGDYPIRVDIDSSNGPDLDKVEFWVYVNNNPSKAIPLGNTIPAFTYGGQVGESFTASTQAPGSNGDTTGVMPYEVSGDSLGHDLFVLNQDFSTITLRGGTLPNGEHSLVVRATDVNGNSATDIIQRFVIQKPELIYGYVDPPAGDANTDFYYYVYYNDPSGNVPAATNVYIDETPYTMTLYGGSASDGSYVFGPVRLSVSTLSHNYFFNFTDGLGGAALLPSTGKSPGPTVASYTLIASVNPSGGGAITGSEINCGSVCSASYAPDTALTLSAAPGDGYIFMGWTGCDSSNDTACSVMMSADRNISANFTSLAPGGLAWANTFGAGWSDWADSIEYTSDGGSIIAGYDGMSGNAYAMKLAANGDAQWRKTYGGSDEFFSAQQTSDGGYFLAGDTYTFGAGSYDVLAVKLDATGNVQWQKAYGGSNTEWVSSAIKTNDEGFAIAGWTYSFGSGAPSYDDLFIIKLDANGTVQWQKAYGGGKYEGAYSIQQTLDGGYVVAGVTTSFSATRSNDAWILKLDADGNIQWQKTYGSDSGWDEADSIQQTSDGGYIVAGETESWGAGRFDAWILKLDANGNIQWQQSYGGSDDDDAASVKQTADGGYIVAGDTYSFGAGGYDAWVLKLDAAGNIQWQKTYGGINDDGVSSIQQIPGGGYVLAGYSELLWGRQHQYVGPKNRQRREYCR